LSYQQHNLGIKSWAVEDRPREKLLRIGRKQLTDAELIAILIGSGTKSESAVGLSKKILASLDNNLASLAKLEVEDLIQFKGIGKAKAISIVAALELGRRRKYAPEKINEVIRSSGDAFQVMAVEFMDLEKEEFWIILLNRANRVMEKIQISQGGVAGTVVDPKIIFKNALKKLSSSIVLVHNHPSTDPEPSHADSTLTMRLRDDRARLGVEGGKQRRNTSGWVAMVKMLKPLQSAKLNKWM